MENVKIQFKGITRNTDDGICPDGECMELINAKVNNSSIEPIGNPIQLKQTVHTYKEIYHHANAKRYIGITEDGQMYEMPEDLSSETIMTEDVKAKSIQFIGNTVSVLTDTGVKYLLFKNDGYVYLGELPDMPGMTIRKKLAVVDADITEVSELSDTEVRYGNFVKVLNNANKKGYYCYAAAFCAAFRLFDGSIVKTTEIKIPFLGYDDIMSYNYNSSDSGSVSVEMKGGLSDTQFIQVNTSNGAKAALLCFKPEFVFDDYDLSAWADIILSIDIFSTDSLRFKVSDLYDNIESATTRASNISLMYNIAELKIGETTIVPDLDVSSDNMTVQKSMVDGFGYNHKINASKSYSYNNRLHLFGITKTLFDGYKIVAGAENYTFDVYTYIHTSNGDKIVHSSQRGSYIPSFIIYPDSRAYKIVVNCASINKGKTFLLNSSNYFNFSYYCRSFQDVLTSTKYRCRTSYFTDTTTDDFVDMQYLVRPTDNIDYSKDNILLASNVNNPFYFPSDQTYQFQTPIVGVQSNVIAMSQGQFGQFPLYVFTKDGIYAMSVGSGTLAYSTQTPVTRDVCNNPDSICGLDTMVAFSTERGLMVIDGATTQLISEKIYGFLPSCSISSPIITRILAVAGLDSCLSSVVFPDYLETAKVGYNYETKEVVVANRDFPYSYVYSLKTGEWHKISQQIDSFVNSYPYTWAMIGTQILDLNNMHRSVSKIALVTRPIKMGTLTHKRILQTALRGIVKRSLSDLYIKGEPVMFRGEGVDIFSDVGMYILASNDAEHFELVAKKEKMIDIRDLVTKMNKSKPYKYFMICLVGGVRTDVSVNYIEMMVDESFTNRLR